MFLPAIFHQNCQAVLAVVSINGLITSCRIIIQKNTVLADYNAQLVFQTPNTISGGGPTSCGNYFCFYGKATSGGTECGWRDDSCYGKRFKKNC